MHPIDDRCSMTPTAVVADLQHTHGTRFKNEGNWLTVAGDERLLDCPEATVGLSLPSPLNERLDQLVQLAEGAAP
jgi:hypothetical protein